MIEVCPKQVTLQLTSLFDPHAPASLRCFGVLAGAEAGKIITDDPIDPAWAMVWEATDGTLYLGGALDAPTIQHVVNTLRSDGDILIGFWDGDPLAGLLPPSPDYVGTVLEFLDRPDDTTDLDAVVRHLPPDHTLRRMDSALLERSLWYDIRRHGSAEAFLAKSLAVCLMHGDTIVCEASTSPSIAGVRELGVITDEQHRGRGYATVTCAYLIQVCAQAGDRTYWNCAGTNVASASVARKLGYQTEREYRLLAWFKSTA